MSTVPCCRLSGLAAAAALLALVACGGGAPNESSEAPAEAGTQPVTPTVAQAAEASYAGIWDGADVTLSGGRYENAEERSMVWLVEGVTATGDLDGDGVEDRVVVVAESSGGSGSYLYVTALRASDQGRPLPVALIGDRVQLRDLSIDSGQVLMSVVQAGEQDAMCCPGEMASRRWVLGDGVLQEQEVEVTGRLSLQAVSGDWRLAEWNWQEPVDAAIEITLTIDGTALAGSSGCNRYNAQATEGDAAGDLSIGPVAGTRMMCPEPQMAAEQRYLTALGGAVKFGFLNGRLAITTVVDEQVATLMFARPAP